MPLMFRRTQGQDSIRTVPNGGRAGTTPELSSVWCGGSRYAASSLTCLKDHPRKGEKFTTLSPSGTLAATIGSLGCTLLLGKQLQALVVVQIWKGYHDASFLFLEMLVNRGCPGQVALTLNQRRANVASVYHDSCT